ncbi:Lipid transfer-like protein VAS [Rhynchospora pubera]|uniref:Lipid transfer-like protein VAS n=1 Tax=Rhynchospora pubera TaxID=906938 RepID=A0AAV8E5E0_9POAL|nr:Lipid transfer-like protein VAS [Rhynchospora pubera]KAJ4776548.1 Lipid transfer-like protein VAS [Rhynchospora pubera]
MAFVSRTLALFIAISAMVASTAIAQDLPPCVSSLAPCANYLNSTATPPETCCAPLRDAAVKQTVCLCNLLNNKELLKTFNVDPAQGLRLAKSCNASADASTCSKAAASAAPTTSPSTSSSSTTSKSTPAEKSTNAAQKATWTAVNAIMCLLFPLLWIVMA